ncbi:phosphodiester glycosidase family protein [Antarctobacter sp.]|uniref:phosphodiester glycosidase family protein n=1 Tax=Antarctobacter sp. TaxID=1872577 RepID=UPI002B2736E0|nr:phosphodiester glycosidase family protein [Antarctobacter sp.]
MRHLLPSLALMIAALASAPQAGAVSCGPIEHDGNRYVVCEVDAAKEDLRLFRSDADGTPYGHFSVLESELAQEGQSLVFAMNAGMYHEDRSPVGHYLEEGREEMRVISSPGPGNFGLLPNGIFCIGKDWARVIETRDFLNRRPKCRYATQSGPMLVIDGALHPRFLPDSTSRYIRNGVGTSADGRRAFFAISQNTVTFHEFARLFRDALKLPNALFLDGNISRLYAPQVGRADLGRRMGPIVAVTTPAQ